jgi:hypothetical protein
MAAAIPLERAFGRARGEAKFKTQAAISR